jgi:steroid delta-isomerase-like uncharacterized protein
MEQPLASKIRAANSALLVEGDLDAVGEYFAGNYVAHFTGRDWKGGPDAVRAFVDTLRRSFADLRVDVEILVEGEDRVAWQRTVTGVQKSDFMGFPPAGKPIVWRDMVTSRFEDGRIAEDWSISDLAERLLYARNS